MSNFTTGSTPRNCACTIGCELRDRPEGVWGCAEALPNAKRRSVIAAKQSRTPTRTRNLKNADWEVDFFFMDGVWVGWWISLKTPGAFEHRLSYFNSLVAMGPGTPFLAGLVRARQDFLSFSKFFLPTSHRYGTFPRLISRGKTRPLFAISISSVRLPRRSRSVVCLPLNGRRTLRQERLVER